MWAISKNRSWEYLEQRFDWVRDMRDVPQDPIHHAEGNVDVHTQMVLAAMEQDAFFRSLSPQEREILLAAALLHDVEKRSTTVTGPDGRISSKGHARKGAQTARLILYRDVPAPFSIREQVYGLVKHHSLPLWLTERRDPLKTAMAANLEVNTEWLALLARADVLGRTAYDKADLLRRVESFASFCRAHGCWGETPQQQRNESPPAGTTVVLMSGLSAAARNAYISENLPGMPVISPDEDNRAKDNAKKFLQEKQSFAWNAANITRQLRHPLIRFFTANKAAVKIVYVEVPYAELPPGAGLDKQVRRLEVPGGGEASTLIYHIRGNSSQNTTNETKF